MKSVQASEASSRRHPVRDEGTRRDKRLFHGGVLQLHEHACARVGVLGGRCEGASGELCRELDEGERRVPLGGGKGVVRGEDHDAALGRGAGLQLETDGGGVGDQGDTAEGILSLRGRSPTTLVEVRVAGAASNVVGGARDPVAAVWGGTTCARAAHIARDSRCWAWEASLSFRPVARGVDLPLWYEYGESMSTIRTTANLDATLLTEAEGAHPDLTRTALLELALRTLLARDAARRLAALGGSDPDAQRPRRSAWNSSG